MKALVVGLDGATFRVLDPLMEAGVLPNLRRVLERGVRADLLSTVPPVTALAWPSFMTGNAPGRHGLLSWQGALNEKFERPWVTAAHIHGPNLWDLAGKAGLRSCVYNVPLTYPPSALEGVMVTGMLTPGPHAQFTYPPELRDDLLTEFPTYQVDMDTQRTERDMANIGQVRAILDEANRLTQQRGAALRWLLEREEHPDLVIAVWETPDRLQHYLWKYIASLPAVNPRLPAAAEIRDGLLRCYAAVDAEIGALLDAASDETFICLLSDHGFGPINTMVFLNQWLEERGWLTFDARRAGGRALLRRVGRLVKPWLPGAWTHRARASFPVLHTVDWSRTSAYAGMPAECGIFLNVKGREPAGTVEAADYEPTRDAILAALREWVDPRTGERVLRAAHRREDVYSGPFVQRAPDIVLEFTPGYHASHLPYRGQLLMDVSDMPIGFHEREGIFGLAGPGIRAGATLAPVAIEDVTPTLLYALGLPVPQGLDGRILVEAVAPEHYAAHSPRYAAPDSAGNESHSPNAGYSAEEAEKVAARMRSLGYLE